MTMEELALKHIRGMSTDELAEFLDMRLFGLDTTPLSGVHGAESPESVISELLKSPSLGEARRETIIGIWRMHACLACGILLIPTMSKLDAKAYARHFATWLRLMNVADAAQPPELRDDVLAYLLLVRHRQDVPKEIKLATCRAALAHFDTPMGRVIFADCLDVDGFAPYINRALAGSERELL